jgi:hypothetical protein
MSEYEAQENVSEQAICYFIARMNICVNDLSYPALRETYKQMSQFKSLSEIFQTRYDTLRAETNDLLKRHKNILDRLGSICSAYGDILSLAAPLTSIIADLPAVTGVDPRFVQLVEQLFSLVMDNIPTYNILGGSL